MITLQIIKRTENRLLEEMARHYSKPKGFVGRNICFAVTVGGVRYGSIVGGSATRFLPGRDQFLGYCALEYLNNIINNIFFHVEPVDGKYPARNFTTKILQVFEKAVVAEWYKKYGDEVVAIESLVELPRTGECYRRAGYTQVGTTKGYTCKRISGKGTDSWSGSRVWDTQNLRPKLVFIKKIT